MRCTYSLEQALRKEDGDGSFGMEQFTGVQAVRVVTVFQFYFLEKPLPDTSQKFTRGETRPTKSHLEARVVSGQEEARRDGVVAEIMPFSPKDNRLQTSLVKKWLG